MVRFVEFVDIEARLEQRSPHALQHLEGHETSGKRDTTCEADLSMSYDRLYMGARQRLLRLPDNNEVVVQMTSGLLQLIRRFFVTRQTTEEIFKREHLL